MAVSPGLTQREANVFAWQGGKHRLVAAVAAGSAFAFETTLGGKTITQILIAAVIQGAVLRIWFVGLANIELHLARVAARVHKGGHDIPERDIRQRWVGSHANLISLIPHVTDLRVYDNSLESDLVAGTPPQPWLVLAIEEKKLTFPPASQLADTPPWAKPIVYAAYQQLGRAG